jgi:hypothetical protein
MTMSAPVRTGKYSGVGRGPPGWPAQWRGLVVSHRPLRPLSHRLYTELFRREEYDTGVYPTVAADPQVYVSRHPQGGSAVVVELHQAALGISDSWYHVGTVVVADTGIAECRLFWFPSSYRFDYGSAPA